MGIFFSKCRVGRIYPTDLDQRTPGVYFRYVRLSIKSLHTSVPHALSFAFIITIIVSFLWYLHIQNHFSFYTHTNTHTRIRVRLVLCSIRYVCHGRAPFPPAHCVRLCPLLLFLTSYCHLLPQHFLHSALFARSRTSSIYLSSYIYPHPQPHPVPIRVRAVISAAHLLPTELSGLLKSAKCLYACIHIKMATRSHIYTQAAAHRADTLNQKWLNKL